MSTGNKPKVSIICLTYNHKKYISQTIEGFLMQKTSFPFEIVIHDDASTDGTSEIIKQYEAKFPDLFNCIYQTENQKSKGRAVLPVALERAKGKYIALCEGDDYWIYPHKLQKQIDFLEANNEFAICFHNAKVLFDDPQKKETLYSDFPWNNIDRNRDIYTIEDLIAAPLCPTASVVFRKPVNFIIPDWYHKVPSGDMALEIILCGDKKIKYFDEIWAVYRKHSGGITANHRGDWIHTGRIYMYLRIYEHYNGKYKDSIAKVLRYHISQLKTWDLISKEDTEKIFDIIGEEKKVQRKVSLVRKKIVFVAYGPNQINGPNIWLQRILPELSKRGFEPVVIFLMYADRQCEVMENLRKSGIKCIPVPRQPFTEQNIIQILIILNEISPDIFVPNLSVPAYFASKWIKEAGIPTVGILHSDDIFHHELIEHFVSGLPEYRLSAILAVSRFIEGLVKEKGIFDTEILHCPYGISVPDRVADPPQVRLNLIYTGRLIQRQKRIFDVINSLKNVVCEIPETYATIYGEDREGGRVINTIKGLNLGERLRYGGLLKFDEIFHALLKHHVFVLLSDYEGISISLMEAMGCGLVPVCTKTRSGAMEIIKHNENGLLVENRDEDFINAIRRLKYEKGLWERLSKRARETILKGFTIDICADRWAVFLNRLMEKTSIRNKIRVPEINDIMLPPIKQSENGISREDSRLPRQFIKHQPLMANSRDNFVNVVLSPENMDLYIVRSEIHHSLHKFLQHCEGILLDIGCGEMPYREMILKNSRITKYIGMDIENPKYQVNTKPDIFWDGDVIPLDDNSVDYAIATELFEHLPDIDGFLKEVRRVLKPNGMFFFTVPFLWPLHDNPQDEYRYTPFSLKRHLENAGFTEINIEAMGGWDASLAQMIGLWVRRSPMTSEERARFTELIYPFYKELLEREKRSKTISYEDMCSNSIMITGLTGTCIKSTEVVKKKEPVLAIVCPQIGAISETFIRKHIEYLSPEKTVVLTGDVLDNTWFNGSVKIIPIEIGHYKFNAQLEKEVVQFLKTNKVTHILCEFGCIGGAVINLSQRLLHLPVYLHFHGQDASEFLRRPDIVSYYRWMGSVVDGVIAVSNPMKNRLIDIGIPSEKIRVIHYGVNIPDDIASPEKDPCRFIAVTRLVAKKGIMYLLKAFLKTYSKNPNTTLEIIGDGPMRNEVEDFIKENNLVGAVTLYGLKPNEFVLERLKESSVYVQHSITDPATGNAEGLPNSILEASACGLPVIATNHEGIPEAVEHGITGFLVDESDADKMAEYMLKLSFDGNLRKSMGLSARKKMINEGFTTEKMIKKLRNFMGIDVPREGINYQVEMKAIGEAPKKVLFVNHSVYPYELSGTPLSTYNHAIGMKDKGMEVAVLIPFIGVKQGYEKELRDGLTIYKVPYFDKFKAFFLEIDEKTLRIYLNSIKNIIREFQPDIVHINDYVFMPYEIVEIFKESGCIVMRNVCNMEELCFFDAPIMQSQTGVLCSGPDNVEKCANCFFLNLLQKTEKDIKETDSAIIKTRFQIRNERIKQIYDRYIDGVIFTTNEFKKYFVSFVPISEEKIRIIPRGFKIDFQRKSEAIKINDNDLIIFAFVGNAIYRKGIDILLKAFEEISSLEGFKLDIYGGIIEEYRTWVRQLENKYPSKIEYHGQYKISDIFTIAQSIHVAIAPSYFETYHRVVREMLYFGIPVIVTDFFGSSIIEDGINGFRVPIGDYKALANAMKRLVKDKRLIEVLSKGAIDTKIPDLREEIEKIYTLYSGLFNKNTTQTNMKNMFHTTITDKLKEVFSEAAEKKVTETSKKYNFMPKMESIEFSEPDFKGTLTSVVIPVKNNWDYTKICLDSIVRYTDVPYEIIVVDNGSEEPLYQYIKKWRDRNPKIAIRYLCLNENKGFAGGCNEGTRAASGDYLVFLNNDTLVTPGWLKGLLKPLALDNTIGIAGPMSNYVNGRQKINDCPINFKSPKDIDFGRLAAYGLNISNQNQNSYLSTEVIMGLCLAIKKELFDAIGGFDERFYPGNFEDNDLSMRIHMMGLKRLICRNVFIYHFGNKTFTPYTMNYYEAYKKNFVRFKEKWKIDDDVNAEMACYEILLKRKYNMEALINKQSLEDDYILISPFIKNSIKNVLDFYQEGKLKENVQFVIACNGIDVERVKNTLYAYYSQEELEKTGDITLFEGNINEILNNVDVKNRFLLFSWKDRIEDSLLSCHKILIV